MSKMVVVGTGTMADGIGAGFLQAGYEVVFLGRDEARTRGAAERSIGIAQALGAVAGRAALGSASTGTIDGWNDWDRVDWVVETVAEDLPLKQALFASLDARVPAHVPIGSNSSGFPIGRIAAGLPTRRRMFNAHYFMPAHLVPLVEIALGADSDPALGEQVCELYRQAGKKPVLVRRDIPGFLANRIQHALMREALSLIDSGIASPSDVDTAVRYSFGFRYAAAGPILQKEISGWDGMARAAAEIYPSLSNTEVLSECVSALMAEGRVGMKSGAGFETWSPEAAALERAAYERRLKAAFEVLQLDGGA
ncbi:MAG: 3-hydroxyacyl-CoA dehydrogenase [Comamonadaceae bacterium]|nr:MAG: 3-hydroxyacyl-CoA dehydrogenase [Comamonadaceae bacterium]